MNSSLIFSALLVGFLGSFHCVGMCGPIAIALPKSGETKGGIIIGRLLYNIGRIVTYSLLGLIAGLIGYSFSIKGFQSELSIFSGILILIIVLFTNGNRISSFIASFFGKYTLKLKQKFKLLFSSGSPSLLFSIGLLNGLLPCGFVYLALAGALATGHCTGGMLYMTLFGLGTIPAMLTISMAGHLIGAGFKKQIRKVSPFIAIALAVLLIYRGSGEKAKCCENHTSEFRLK